MINIGKKQFDKGLQIKSIQILDMLIENEKSEIKEDQLNDTNILADLNTTQMGVSGNQSNTTADKFIKEGGIRMAVNKLQDVNTPLDLGVNIIKMVKKIPMPKIMNVNELYQSTMQFISNQNNNQQVQSIAQSFL